MVMWPDRLRGVTDLHRKRHVLAAKHRAQNVPLIKGQTSLLVSA